MAKIRAGAVSYLNTRPLVFGLEQGLGAGRFDLTHDVPSGLAAGMAAGDLDLALLPVIELCRIPGLSVVPGIAIGSYGPARSVFVVARKPFADLTSLSLDPESRTSNALAAVVLAEAFGVRPKTTLGPRDLGHALAECDAAVRIGDKALFEPLPDGVAALDLGEAWTQATGLPFVFAVWAARPGVVDRGAYEILHESKRAGMAAIPAIADDYTWNGRRHPGVARAYLQEAMRYRLGDREVAAMRRFLSAAGALGLVESVPPVELMSFSAAACAPVAAEPRP